MKPLIILARQQTEIFVTLHLHTSYTCPGYVEADCIPISCFLWLFDLHDIPPPPPPLELGVSSSLFSLASFAFSCPVRCEPWRNVEAVDGWVQYPDGKTSPCFSGFWTSITGGQACNSPLSEKAPLLHTRYP
jgi:hypothetical protein